MKPGSSLISGFTLMELMIVMTMVGIIASVGAPGLVEMVQRNRLIATQQLLVASLRFTRGEAVSRNKFMTMCKSNGSTNSCSTSGTVGWDDGWIIFLDEDGAGDYDVGTDTIVRVVQGISGDATIFGSGNGANRVTFDSAGSTGNNSTFRICDDRGASGGLGAVLSNPGRIRRLKDSDGDGTVDNNGTELTCP